MEELGSTGPDFKSPAVVASAEIEVKFVIVPEGFSHSRRFAHSLSLLDMKSQIEQDLRIPIASMKLVYAGTEMLAPMLSDYAFLRDAPNQVQLQIVYIEEHATPTMYAMPDVISVEVHFGADLPPKLIQVPVVRCAPTKAFMGGYRSRKVTVCSASHHPPANDIFWPAPPQPHTNTPTHRHRHHIPTFPHSHTPTPPHPFHPPHPQFPLAVANGVSSCV